MPPRPRKRRESQVDVFIDVEGNSVHKDDGHSRPFLSSTLRSIFRTFSLFLVCAVVSFLILVLSEAELLNQIFNMYRQHHASYFKFAVAGGLSKLLKDHDEVSFDGPRATTAHYIWVNFKSGCTHELPRRVMCVVESLTRNLGPETRAVMWAVQPPQERGMELAGPSWERCAEDRHLDVPGGGSLLVRPLVMKNDTRLGRWFFSGNISREIWEDPTNLATIADFHRLYVFEREEEGGLYLDTDMLVMHPSLSMLSDGVFMQFRYGAHMINNAVFKLTGVPGSREFLRLCAEDWIARFSERGYFGMLGPALFTRVFLHQMFSVGGATVNVYPRHVAQPSKCSDFISHKKDILAVHMGSGQSRPLGEGVFGDSLYPCVLDSVCEHCPVTVAQIAAERDVEVPCTARASENAARRVLEVLDGASS
mmetsp:Transcript_11139/g.30779  ORF Transcript_11139/g.30779 Transcript_11139/m.30779 type:complete len:422 (-) Transcript_11139:83-1348(-)